jgi:Tol biopolymer transport system component
MGGTWNREGVIVFASSGPLRRVSASGGDPKPVLSLDKSRQETSQLWPSFLPDGRHFLYLSRSSDAAKTGVYAASLDSADTKLVLNGETMPGFAPPGFLLFTRQETLLAQPFDTGKLQVRGEPVPVAEGVGQMFGGVPRSLYSVSTNGVLVYRSGNAPDLRLVSYGRDGKRAETIGDPDRYQQIALSPDETRLTVERMDTKTNTWDVWLLELRSGILSRVTFDPGNEWDAVWSPDGRQIVFGSDRKGHLDLYRETIGGGEEELLIENAERKVPEDWLKDGSILYTNQQGKTIYRLPLTGDRKPEVLLQTEFDKDEPHVSPDQRWIAYGSNESGRWEVYVASFPKFTDRRQISTSGGGQAIWRKDGKELFYFGLDGKMMAVDVKAGATIETGVPKVLFETRLRPAPTLDQYAVTGDGKRFIVTEPVEESAKPTTVILNWTAKLPR